MQDKSYKIEFAGRPLEVVFSRLAEQADGSVVVKYGGTVALVTAVMAKTARPDGDFFPLTVDYEEKYYAAGKIYGSRFIRRETRPSEGAILTARMIDRTIRPRFDPRIRREVQIVTTILSIDGENDPDFPGLLGASLALSTSPIPFSGPVAGIRVARANEEWVINPTYKERETATLDLFAGGIREKINMIEVGAKEVSEEDALEALELAQEEIRKLAEWQEKIIAEKGVEKEALVFVEPDRELVEKVKAFLKDKLEEAIFTPRRDARDRRIRPLLQELEDYMKEAGEERNIGKARFIFDEEVNELVHKKALEESRRADGRAPDEIRPLDITTGALPRTHGSALFMRGNTQALSVVTLGAPGDVLLLQGMEVTGEKRFLHHYNFPPYSVGETGRMGSPGRREIGHGALAEKALFPLIPTKENFPYTIRIVSEILSSNGSSSMASVCGSSLALMDAGVPIPKHAAGISMGLMLGEKGEYKILRDIQGPEDHHGDMDCKVAGTRDGITAIQMDVKVEGVTLKILKDALEGAKKAREEILGKMEKVIAEARPNLSPFAPRVISIQIPQEKIREVIGPGGKVINAIIGETGAQIDIEDSGLVFITAENEAAAEKALEWIKNIIREFKVGEMLSGRVIKILDFGAIVELLPGHEGMVHISELAPYRIERVEEIVKVGDVIPVKVKEIQPDGRIRLSHVEARKDLGEEMEIPAGKMPRREGPPLRDDDKLRRRGFRERRRF